MGISDDCQVPTIRPIVLSAADYRYFRSLWQFLISAERHGLFKRFAWRVYDLGLHQSQIQRLRLRFKWCEFPEFDFSLYPAHVSLESHSYAWKPIIIADTLKTWAAPVFWFDSATILHTGLAHPLSIVRENGIWALRSKSPLNSKCDVKVLDALQVPLAVRHVQERAAGALGFDPDHAAAVQLAIDWKRHAMVADFIVPEAAASYHKQDQAIFNCLLLKAAAEGTLKLTEEEIDISSARPAKDVTTRNIIDPSIPIWADPVVRLTFSAYKKADQLNHRLQQFSSRRLGGARRWWKEHFTVHVCDLQRGIKRRIPSPTYGYYADPFIWQHNGSNWLFVEEFQYAKDKGRLVVMELTDTLEPVSPRPLVSTRFYGDFDCHASFPHIFAMNGETYMIPETCQRKSVDLYVCEQWPDRWRLERRLLFNLDAADTMVLWSGGLWWLVTSVRTATENRHLEIFFTDNLLTGTLRAHPINSACLYADRRNGTGRNAGYLVQSCEHGIRRLMQKSTHFYGEGVAAMEVVALNTEDFEERVIGGIEQLPMVDETFSSHHVSRAGNLIAYDTRDRAR